MLQHIEQEGLRNFRSIASIEIAAHFGAQTMRENMMYKFWIVALNALSLAGCGRQGEREVKENEGININVPGVQIKINEREGVSVKAPGVDVKINEQEGVNVKAPRTDVKINREDGVDVSAPGADVKVKPGE